MYLEMIFRDSFYHADPHPGNLSLLDGGVVGVLDCGMVGRLDETLHEQIESMLLAVCPCGCTLADRCGVEFEFCAAQVFARAVRKRP